MESSQPVTPHRVIVYIDGFNLYFGLKSKRWKRYYWLDMWRLAENLVRRGRVTAAHYFTASVRANPPKESRQQAFLAALRVHRPALDIVYGHYLLRPWQCRKCGHVVKRAEEKKTDVNIATQLLHDAFRDAFDTAFIVSGDSDLAPPIELVCTEMTGKRVIVAFPPSRVSAELKRVATGWFYINQQVIRTALLPNPVIRADGRELWKPEEWR